MCNLGDLELAWDKYFMLDQEDTEKQEEDEDDYNSEEK